MAKSLGPAPHRWHGYVPALFEMKRRTAFILCVALGGTVAIADILTPPQLNLTFVYVPVILLATWNIGVFAGIGFACFASVMQFIVMSELTPPFRDSIFWSVVLANRVFTFAVVVALTVPLRRLYDRERVNARHDPLTGAANTSYFAELLGTEIARSRRSAQALTVAYLDCDDFKAINDRYGHAQGDAVLRAIVDSVKRTVRSIDAVARMGGDEFAILFPQTDAPRACRALERLQAELHGVLCPDGMPLSMSVGAVTFEDLQLTPAEVVSACDALMYRAKQAGKHQLVHEVIPGREMGIKTNDCSTPAILRARPRP